MEQTAPLNAPARRPAVHPRRLRAVEALPDGVERASAPRFSEAVRTVLEVARRRDLRPPVFRSPPGLDGIDRSIRRRSGGTVVVAVRRQGRPLPAVHADVIEGVVAANDLSGEAADRFRHEAWAALDRRVVGEGRRATMMTAPPARVA